MKLQAGHAVDLKNEDLLRALQEMRSQHESFVIDGGRVYRVRTEVRQKIYILKFILLRDTVVNLSNSRFSQVTNLKAGKLEGGDNLLIQ